MKLKRKTGVSKITLLIAFQAASRYLYFVALAALIVVILNLDNSRLTIFWEPIAINQMPIFRCALESVGRVLLAGFSATFAALSVASVWSAGFPGRPAALLSTALLLAITPSMIWLTLSILVFGLSERTIIFSMILSCIFLEIAVLTIEFAKIDSRIWFIATQLRLNFSKRLTVVVYPYTREALEICLRLSFAVCWMSVVFAESIGAQFGLGVILNFGRQVYDFQLVMVGWCLVIIGSATTDIVAAAFTVLLRLFRQRGST